MMNTVTSRFKIAYKLLVIPVALFITHLDTSKMFSSDIYLKGNLLWTQNFIQLWFLYNAKMFPLHLSFFIDVTT